MTATLRGVSRQPKTRAEWVESEIRRAILEGRLRAGERLNMTELSESLEVSPTPLREALQRLASNGLITLTPQRGAYVTELTATDLSDIYKLRILLEPKAAEDAAARATPQSRAAIEAAYNRTVSITEPLAREAAQRDFHITLGQNCGSPRLISLIKDLLDHSARYPAITRSHLGQRPEVNHDHRLIADAAINGESELVGRLVREHTQHNFDAAMASLEAAGYERGLVVDPSTNSTTKPTH